MLSLATGRSSRSRSIYRYLISSSYPTCNLVLVLCLGELPRLLLTLDFNSFRIIASVKFVLLHFFGLGSNSRASAFIIVHFFGLGSNSRASAFIIVIVLARALLDTGEVMRQGFRRRAAAAADSAAMLAPVALPIVVWMG